MANLQDRNFDIWEAYHHGGKSGAVLAEEHGVSQQRISQIVREDAPAATHCANQRCNKMVVQRTRGRRKKCCSNACRQQAWKANQVGEGVI